MIRIVAFLVAVIVVAAVATWISEPPGRVEIAWGDYMVETSPGSWRRPSPPPRRSSLP